MAWYAYCITEQQTLSNGTRSRRPSLLEGVQGVNGASVLAYPSGEFNIVVSEYERDNVQFGEKNVLEHARVVSVCFRSGTVLPFRFGTIFDSDEALRQAVRSNRRTFGQSVARLRGKAEMHLKLRVKDGSLREAMADIVLPDTVGGDYLIKLREKPPRTASGGPRPARSRCKSISCSIRSKKRSVASVWIPMEC